MSAKAVRDLHGLVDIYPEELEVIEHPVFQRLRNIRQLALTNFVYPGAEHTRFAHSLGAMALAGRAFNSMAANGGLPRLSAVGRARAERLVRLAALVHDVGHSPFSHAGERRLFPEGMRHEEYTRRLIDGPLRSTIRRQYRRWFSPDDLLALGQAADPDEAYLQQLIDGPADVDKMDYLLRDSYYCNVRYGEFDLLQVLSKLRVRRIERDRVRYNVLALGFGGLHAYEEFVLARYWMHAQVYFHSVRRQLDLMLEHAMHHVLAPTGRYPRSLEHYLAWDDPRAIRALAASRGPWAVRLRSRRPYFARVYDEQGVSLRGSRPTDSDPESVRFSQVAHAMRRELGDDVVFVDETATIGVKLYSGRDSARGFPMTVENAQGEFVEVETTSTTLRNFPSSVTFYRIFVEPGVRREALRIRTRVLGPGERERR